MTISPVRHASSAPVVAGVADLLARLNDLTLDELRAEWRRLYRSAPPRLSRDLMRRAIAYLPRPCRSYAEAKHDSARGLRPHRETRIGPYRGEQPMSVTTANACCSANRGENK